MAWTSLIAPIAAAGIGAGLGSIKKKTGNYDFTPPSFQGGDLTVDGMKRASVRKSGNNISTQYNRTPAEQAQNQWRWNTMSDTEKTIGAPSDQQMSRWTDVANYRKDRALSAYDDDASDVWSSFRANMFDKMGGVGNTQSVLGYGKLEADRNKYRSQLASDYDYNIESLGQQEDQRLYNLLGYLSGQQQLDENSMYKAINQSMSASQLGNQQALSSAGLTPALSSAYQQQQNYAGGGWQGTVGGALTGLDIYNQLMGMYGGGQQAPRPMPQPTNVGNTTNLSSLRLY